MNVHIHHHGDYRLDEMLANLKHLKLLLIRQGVAMSAELDALKSQVASNSSVVDSAVTLINGIAARIDAAVAGAGAVDKQALVDLSAELKAKDAALAAAVAANTVAASPSVVPTP